MKVVRPLFSKPLPLSAAILALCLCAVPVRAATAPVGLVDSKLQDGTILTSKPDKLVSTVREGVKENPPLAGHIVFAVLSSGRADADALAPQVVVAAIGGLGENPSSAGIASIVHYAVKATPAVVFEIVRAAAKASPKEAVPAIVTAAVKAVPNPNEKVHPLAEERSRAGFSKDAKDGKDLDAANNADSMPLSEAIARAAQQGSGLDLAGLMSTASIAAAQAVTAGVNGIYYGYYYPPLLPLLQTTGVDGTVPNPPVVSK